MKHSPDKLDDRSPAVKMFDAISSMAREAGMANDPRIRKALRLISANPSDRRAIQESSQAALRLIKRSPLYLAKQRDQNPFQPYPTHSVTGPIRIGWALNPFASHPLAFGLHPHELNQNVLLFGRAGSGKTVTLFNIVSNLMRSSIPFWVIDFKKDYRHWIRQSPQLHVYNWRNFKFNPLAPPPNTPARYWIQTVSEIFFQAFFPASPATAAKSVFLDLLDSLFDEAKEKNGFRDYPSLFDVQHAINQAIHDNRTPSGWKERYFTVESRLRPLLSMMPEMLDCVEGYSIQDLLQLPVVLELDGLTEEIQTFLVNTLFYWIFTYRLNTVQRGSLKHVLLFDEAKMVFEKKRASGTSTISRLVSMARELGQGVVCADQMPSTLGHSILANVYTMIGLSLSAQQDIREMAAVMGLTPEQKEFMNHLPVGMGIVKMADRYTRPFLIKIPDVPLQKNVTDAEVEQHMAPILRSLSYKPRKEQQAEVKTDTGKAVSPKQSESSENVAKESSGPESPIPFSLNELEFLYLMDVRAHPFLAINERNHSLKITHYMGNRISQKLLELNLVTAVDIRTTERGRASKYLELTAKAVEQVGKQNLGPGKGGFEHVFHQQRFQALFTDEGYKAVIEEFHNGKSVDLGLTKDSERIAVELAMSPAGEVSNFLKDHEAGWPLVWSVSRDNQIKSQIEKEWGAVMVQYPSVRVEFHVVTAFKSKPC